MNKSEELLEETIEEICSKMTPQEHRFPTNAQREAKESFYEKHIRPKYEKEDGSICPMLEPDFNEGWK